MRAIVLTAVSAGGRTRRTTRWALRAAAFIVALFLAAPAPAQYFGRNKVQYKNLKFQVLKTEHFDIYYYPQEQAGVDIGARIAERWYARLSTVLGHQLDGRQPLVLYASHSDFEQTNIIQGELGEGTGGVTEPLRRRIVLPLGGSLADTDHVIGHELVHAFQFDITTRPDALPGESGIDRLPLWFIEGMAEYLSLGPVDANTAMWLRDGVQENTLPTVDKLDDPKYFPYRWGQSFWAYVAGRWGDQVVRQMLDAAASSGRATVAIENVLDITPVELSSDWHAAIRAAYAPVMASATPASEIARLLTTGAAFGNEVNVGPAISPDGRQIAFLSSRSLFSIDLYIADTASGRVVRRLTSTASSPHFSSLQFIYSAGAWDAAGKRLAVATVVGGRPAVAIFDVESGRHERDISIPTVDEVFNPAWAPDGRAIAFTGMSQGLTDLYVYDLVGSKLRRLTSDEFTDLQPTWSPDGRHIAFATDRFSTELRTLDIGPYQLAVIDAVSGLVQPVPVFGENTTHLNPQWSPDGARLYFIATPDGIPNLFRLTLATGETARMTDVATGLSGITASSPAFSIAAQSGLAAFSVYEQAAYRIYVMDVSAPRVANGASRRINAAVLPPAERRHSQIAELLADPRLGLPPPGRYPTAAYKPTLSLDAIGQPSAGIGVSQHGVAVSGGIALYFSDLLANRMLATAVQVSTGMTGTFSLKDTAAQAAYFNQAHRWNWGITGGQVPYFSGGYQSGTGVTSRGEPVQIDQTIIYRQTERNAAGIAAYPFNRAQRIELSAGITHLSFDQIVQTTAYSLVTGSVLVDEARETTAAPSLTFLNSAVAFVSDTSNFGATSPVQGQRYRIEMAPNFGAVSFTSLLADYRRYFMPISFYTVALRAVHYGRYGSGGEDSRLYPLYLGYPTLVRGYDVNSFDSSDCVASETSACPALDRLLGSRLLVGNAEFRVPLLRMFGASRRMYGPVPIELALFADGGVAWNRGETPALFGGSRSGVASTGVTVRVNLGGVAIGQFDFVRPLQRPGQGWVFQFNLTPGF